MLSQSLNFFMSFAGKIFTWLNDFEISDNVTWLGVLIAVFFVIVLIDNFIPKG